MPKLKLPKPPRLPLPSSLPNLKLATLRSLLFSIGGKTSGTKPVLLSHLRRDVGISKLGTGAGKTVGEKSRILSIDMGIKNLAFCVCDVTTKWKGIGIDVVAWKRIAVTGDSTSSPPEKSTDESTEAETVLEDDPFGPRVLSATAYALVKNLLLPYKPSTILIEKQRFRSGGGSAIQEWTVRVNMLEAMLWAVLRTMKGEKSLGLPPEVWDVSPRKVGLFWIGQEGGGKVDKKIKIGFAREWVGKGGVDEELKAGFSGDAVGTREAFVIPAEGKGSGSRRNKAKIPLLDVDGNVSVEEEKEVVGKLDDLADSLLQAVTWTRWEQNRRTLAPMVQAEDVEGLAKWVERKSKVKVADGGKE
ncbi:Ydc2-catalyt-domain-containing protein [Tothia fuscella]|uniref:Ydc2-catalyt-domain-containing protein n=1 Tax=Tothia fuscella TaxID=1048955 RepID=A0A9P4NUB2_9PEZI|nr:Ydc2-catalyt-domain-containing protein [Tothia fuscella]